MSRTLKIQDKDQRKEIFCEKRANAQIHSWNIIEKERDV